MWADKLKKHIFPKKTAQTEKEYFQLPLRFIGKEDDYA
jgi:hypothetical protein